MSQSQSGPHEGESDERTRVSHPQHGASQGPAPQVPAAPPAPAPQAAPAAAAPRHQPQQGFGPAGYQANGYGSAHQAQQAYRPAPPPRRKAGYFRSLFDLSYDHLGAPKFAGVFQLLFMLATALAWGIGLLLILNEGIEGDDQTLYFALTAVGGLIAWLLLNTLVRLVLEGVVGIVQTAENTEEMLEIMRERGGA